MKRIKYRCPECTYEFSYDHHPSVEADPCPRYCASCGFDSQGDYAPAVVSPMIGRPQTKAVDSVYEDTTRGAEYRSQVAQEQFGLSQEEANSLKITDFKSNVIEGESSNVEVSNAVSSTMAQRPEVFGFKGDGLGFSQSVSTGVNPNAGAQTQQQVRRVHKQIAYDPAQAGAISSYLPALETQAAGYRRRV